MCREQRFSWMNFYEKLLNIHQWNNAKFTQAASQAEEYKAASFLMIYDNGTLKWVQL